MGISAERTETACSIRSHLNMTPDYLACLKMKMEGQIDHQLKFITRAYFFFISSQIRIDFQYVHVLSIQFNSCWYFSQSRNKILQLQTKRGHTRILCPHKLQRKTVVVNGLFHNCLFKKFD